MFPELFFFTRTVCPVCPVTSFCEPISRVLKKIERKHNMPRKAEHLSSQGKKRFWKSELGLRSYFIFCAAIPILSAREISKKAKIDDANLLITPLFLNRFSKSFFPPKAVMLSFQRKKEFLKSIQKHGSYDWKTCARGQNRNTCTKNKITP